MKLLIGTILVVLSVAASAYAGTNCFTNCYYLGNQRICNTSCN